MLRSPILRYALAATLFIISYSWSRPVSDLEPVVSGPRGIYPYLFKQSVPSRTTGGAGGQNDWSLLAHRSRSTQPQRLHVIAIMTEFFGGKPDTSEQTTGNGLFSFEGGRSTKSDNQEYAYYQEDTVYRYDRLPHFQEYFYDQFQFVKDYYKRVSFGNLDLSFEIFPKQNKAAYHVDSTMVYYSPGGKKRRETWDDYYYRKTQGLVRFVQDAVTAARAGQGLGSPFAGVYRTPTGQLAKKDSTGTELPVAFMIVHAGSSYLTDGGAQGIYGQNSPSDMIDAFVYDEFFSYFRDTLSFDTLGGNTGILINDSLLVNEFMMTSETSNQDGLNWGIHGIIVNQIARQLGIPDLYSTSSGISGIGAFCIMDFAGYSAAQGFIPPWPSAWVRAYMGWDKPVVVPIGIAAENISVTAIGAADPTGRDTTILLVPINDHEYYLIENRQRSLDNNPGVFNYDTTDDIGIHISSYPYNVNLSKNVTDSSGKLRSNTILGVRNYDVGLPASGLLVWHVDEEVLRGRLGGNMVNADSLYRGISLVEADGINDLGITFQDAFYQAAFDYGGSQDVFPHTVHRQNRDTTIQMFGPKTRPSTRANDGAHSYLTIEVNKNSGLRGLRTEKSLVRGSYLVSNYSSNRFDISVSWDFLSPGWPQRLVPDSVHEPLAVDIYAGAEQEIVLVDRSGRVYVFDGLSGQPLGTRVARYPVINLLGDTLYHKAGDTLVTAGDTLVLTADSMVTDTCRFFAQLPLPASMPSAIGSRLYVPTATDGLHVLRSIGTNGIAVWDTLLAGGTTKLSTWVCNYTTDKWAVGTGDGRVIFGAASDSVSTLSLGSRSPVSAIAAFAGSIPAVVVAQNDGTISLCTPGNAQPDTSIVLQTGIGPYSIVTGDLDRLADSTSEIVVTDSRQGVWVLTANLEISAGWDITPNSWTSAYSYLTNANRKSYEKLIQSEKPADILKARQMLPKNPGAPSLADINKDGRLDIIAGGTNGLYAFNYKGVMLYDWPYYLDNRFWFQRGSVTTSPVVGLTADSDPLVLFSSPTGDRATYAITSVDSTNRDKTTIYFTRTDGTRDSLFDLKRSLVDSILVYNDGLIAPYVLPGGYIDAVSPRAKRPIAALLNLPNTGKEPFSNWPLSVGSSLGSAPLICDIDNNGKADLIGVAQTGWIYRWELTNDIISYSPQQWSQTGAGPGRSFSYAGVLGANGTGAEPAIDFYNYPNPTDGAEKVVFRYKFDGPASSIQIDIFTYTGHHVYSWRPDKDAPASFPDWNEHVVSIKELGPSVYRCRLTGTVKGKKLTKYWKMAVVR